MTTPAHLAKSPNRFRVFTPYIAQTGHEWYFDTLAQCCDFAREHSEALPRLFVYDGIEHKRGRLMPSGVRWN